MATILCVDEPELLETRKLVLESAGHAVGTAATERKALKLLSRFAVDCVVVRDYPPQFDGLAIYKPIREQYPDLPIVLLAAATRPEAKHIVSEHVDSLDGPEALLKALQRVLKSSSKRKRTTQRQRLDKALGESLRLFERTRELEDELRARLRDCKLRRLPD